MLRKIALFLLPFLVFLGMLSLLIMVWYVALPILIVLFIISWIRSRQIQKIWMRFYSSPAGKQRKKDENIIDAVYEEIKE